MSLRGREVEGGRLLGKRGGGFLWTYSESSAMPLIMFW